MRNCNHPGIQEAIYKRIGVYSAGGLKFYYFLFREFSIALDEL